MSTLKRSEKYKDTQTFHYHNANPKNKITEDCVFRAISKALEIDYNKVVMEMAELMCNTGYALNGKKCIDKYLESKGWVKHPQPKHLDGTKFTGKQFCYSVESSLRHGIKCVELCANDRIIANIGGHHIVVIIDGKIWDTWDSSDGCIGNYWTN